MSRLERCSRVGSADLNIAILITKKVKCIYTDSAFMLLTITLSGRPDVLR